MCGEGDGDRHLGKSVGQARPVFKRCKHEERRAACIALRSMHDGVPWHIRGYDEFQISTPFQSQ